MIDWTPGLNLETVEKIVIQQAYKFYRGNKTTTASSLGIAIRTLDAKLEKYDEDDKSRRASDERRKEERLALLARAKGNGAFQLQSSIPITSSRMPMESIANATTEPEVPVQERPEVQEVLQRPAPEGRAKRDRRTI